MGDNGGDERRDPAGSEINFPDMSEKKLIIPPDSVVPDTAESQAYVRGIVERGEAAWPDKNGNLPPGVTHEIVGYHESSGLPILLRKRMY
jgi:hypothetical protein